MSRARQPSERRSIISGIYDPAWLLEIEAVAARPLDSKDVAQ
ncbi:hypothetical protein ACN469_17745 [Corallococcus terminator]